jgi:hypothetical protein
VIDIMRTTNGPEFAGYAMRIGPKLQAAIQLHYINTSSEPQLKEAWVNIVYAAPGTVTTWVDPIFWLSGVGMNVAPNSRQIIGGRCETPPDAPPDLRLLQITGHFHAHTERFSAWKVAGDGTRTLIYESYDYQHPGWGKFGEILDNPLPDPTRKTAGGEHDGALYLGPGERVEWECEIVNDTDSPLRWGNKVYEAEMCNLFGTYSPSMAPLRDTWDCINL